MPIKLPKIFLDSADPEETIKTKGIVGFLDGQTTNPSLIAKNPEVQKLVAQGKHLNESDLLNFYKDVVQQIEKEIAGPLSVEVYADWKTTAPEMLKQAEIMYSWGKNIYIKFPAIPEGVKAAHEFTQKGGKVNMTLVFNQTQAAAVYSATFKTHENIFVSPFIGRWDDRGCDGTDLIKHIIRMYKKFYNNTGEKKPHVKILASSIRNLSHFYTSIFLGADALTVPAPVLHEWVEEGKWLPDESYRPFSHDLKALHYEEISFKRNYEDYQIQHEEGSLLSDGIAKFVSDWKNLLTSAKT